MNFPRSESLDEFRKTFQTLNDISSEQTSDSIPKAKFDIINPGIIIKQEATKIAPRIPNICEPTVAELLDIFKFDLEKEFGSNSGLATPSIDDIISQFREDISQSIDAPIDPTLQSATAVGENEISLSEDVQGGRLFSPARLDDGPILLADNFVEDESSDTSCIIDSDTFNGLQSKDSGCLLSDQLLRLNWEEPVVEFFLDPDFDYDSCPRTPRPDLESLVNTYELQRKRGDPPSLDLLAVHDHVGNTVSVEVDEITQTQDDGARGCVQGRGAGGGARGDKACVDALGGGGGGASGGTGGGPSGGTSSLRSAEKA